MQYFGECYNCARKSRCLESHRNTRCCDYEERSRSETNYQERRRSSVHTSNSAVGIPRAGKARDEPLQQSCEREEKENI